MKEIFCSCQDVDILATAKRFIPHHSLIVLLLLTVISFQRFQFVRHCLGRPVEQHVRQIKIFWRLYTTSLPLVQSIVSKDFGRFPSRIRYFRISICFLTARGSPLKIYIRSNVPFTESSLRNLFSSVFFDFPGRVPLTTVKVIQTRLWFTTVRITDQVNEDGSLPTYVKHAM